jgi:hypothetical protein
MYAMTLSLIAGDCPAVKNYGNELAHLLNKKANGTPVFVDWCEADDAATRSGKAAIIASWPENAFSDPDEPTLVYAVEFAPAMIELGEFDATMTLLNSLSTESKYGGSFTATLQTLNTPNGQAFRCTPEAKLFFSKLKPPPYWKPEPCG